MRVLSINVGMPASLLIEGKPITTGIFKSPIAGTIRIGRLCAAGDGHANQPNHGGPDQALSVYSINHYCFWARRFGRNDFLHGIFGENLTVDGLTEAQVCIGDVWSVGSTRLRVTHPRIPCFRLSHRLGLPLFHEEQLASGRVGYLLRVLEEGEMTAGDDIVLIERDCQPVTVEQCIDATLLGKNLPDVLMRLSNLHHLSRRWRGLVTAKLDRAGVLAVSGSV
jgi:MOSC domain-containing protein YiiM